MNRYEVQVVRLATVQQTASVVVYAESEADASIAALSESDLEWRDQQVVEEDRVEVEAVVPC